MASSSRLTDLHKAKSGKKDEFYTQLEDIELEMKHYKDHFKGKTVLCNCDDPYESNFFKYLPSVIADMCVYLDKAPAKGLL